VTVELPPGAVLLGFSDGLVERRGEDLDVGLARLAAAATGGDGRPLEDTLDRLLDRLTDPGGTDDTVVLALRRAAPGAAG
jgi:serine phosphatase RsbU (regulator of sigma subunit)